MGGGRGGGGGGGAGWDLGGEGPLGGKQRAHTDSLQSQCAYRLMNRQFI